MTRTEVLAKVKELGIKTERPAHQMKTEALVALIHRTVVIEDHKARGRKINPESARQIRLSNTNVGHRGRPADPNSAWNKRQAELAEKRAKGELKLGRQINPESARQKRLALKGTVKRGRPVMVKPVVEEQTVSKEQEAEMAAAPAIAGQ